MNQNAAMVGRSDGLRWLNLAIVEWYAIVDGGVVVLECTTTDKHGVGLIWIDHQSNGMRQS